MQSFWFGLKMHGLAIITFIAALVLAFWWSFWIGVLLIIAVAFAGFLVVQSAADAWIERKRECSQRK